MSMAKTKAVSYNRVSTEEEKQLNALTNQIQENRDVIRQMDWELVGEYIDEGKSGTQTRRREGYNRLFDDLESDRFEMVVIKDQDRLMRNPKDWYLFVDRLLRHNKKLYIHLDQTFYHPDNALLTGIKAILAEEYSRHLSRKINYAHQSRQKKGGAVIVTNRTWGYRKGTDGTVLIDEQERELIEIIFQMYAQGLGSRLIVRELGSRGFYNRNGNELAESQVRAIVRNPLYQGTAVMNRTHINFDTKRKEKVPPEEWKYHENAVPPIVSAGLWAAANRTIESHLKKNGARTVGIKSGHSLLSGKIICAQCRRNFWRNRRTTHNRQGIEKVAVYWYCSRHYRDAGPESGQEQGQKAPPVTLPADGLSAKRRDENGYAAVNSKQSISGCSSLRLKEDELFEVCRQLGDRMIDKRQKEEFAGKIMANIMKILFAYRNEPAGGQDLAKPAGRSGETAVGLRQRQERLLDLLVDGIISKEEYHKRAEIIVERLRMMEEANIKEANIKEANIKETNMEEANTEDEDKEEANTNTEVTGQTASIKMKRGTNEPDGQEGILSGAVKKAYASFTLSEQLQALLSEQRYDLSIPLIAVRIDRIMVFEERLEIFLAERASSDAARPITMSVTERVNGRYAFKTQN